MRVLFVSGEYPPDQGGVGDYTRIVAEHLVRRGLDVHVLTDRDTGKPSESDQPAIWREVKDWGWGSWHVVMQASRRIAADVVHIQYQTAAFSMHPAINFLPYRLGRRCLRAITFHDTRIPYLFPKAGPVRPWVNRMLARGVDLAIVTNIEDEQIAARWLAGSRSRLARVPIGSNIPATPQPGFDRQAWRTGHGIGPDEWTIAYFGFLNASKGGETLIRALDLLAQSGAPARLLMVGGKLGSSDPTNQAYAERVERLVAERSLASRIIWTGFLPAPEVADALAAADCALLPYTEGISFNRGSLMAAFAHGLPVISTRPQILSPELSDRQNVVLIPSEDPIAAAEAVRAVCTQPSLKTRLRQGALKLSELFSWERIAERHVELYEVGLASLEKRTSDRG